MARAGDNVAEPAGRSLRIENSLSPPSIARKDAMARRFSFLLLLTALVAFPARASTLPESCTDSRGHTIAVEVDYQQAELVKFAHGQIRHNPRVLPHLPDVARLFFVAQACARASAPDTVAHIRRADCTAWRMLEAGGQLKEVGTHGLVRELVFTSDEWKLLPGPARSFDFSDCTTRGNVLHLPLATPPSTAQAQWNACTHACGDRLWHCGNSDACLNAYDACLKTCGAAPAATR